MYCYGVSGIRKENYNEGEGRRQQKENPCAKREKQCNQSLPKFFRLFFSCFFRRELLGQGDPVGDREK